MKDMINSLKSTARIKAIKTNGNRNGVTNKKTYSAHPDRQP
jgi:hypothetical protein